MELGMLVWLEQMTTLVKPLSIMVTLDNQTHLHLETPQFIQVKSNLAVGVCNLMQRV